MTITKLEKFLYDNLKKEASEVGVFNVKKNKAVLKAWMDDKNNSKHRFDVIKLYAPESNNILDMAAGCGTFVFYGLLNGYKTYGIDCEEWKYKFNYMKIDTYNYPQNWKNFFLKGFGENLPCENDCFDFVSSYQTLEHVTDVKKCISEMIRVTREGGALHIICPDYRGTYEGHYDMAWFPLLPRKLAYLYLKIRGKKIDFLKTINYTTNKNIQKYLYEIQVEENLSLEIINVDKDNFLKRLEKYNLRYLKRMYPVYSLVLYLRLIFRAEIRVNLLVKINKKTR